MRASEDRQEKEIQLLRSDVTSMGDKLDRLLEHFLPPRRRGLWRPQWATTVKRPSSAMGTAWGERLTFGTEGVGYGPVARPLCPTLNT